MAWDVTECSFAAFRSLRPSSQRPPKFRVGDPDGISCWGSVSALEQQVCSCVICQRKERARLYGLLPLGRALSEAWVPSPPGERWGERLRGKNRRGRRSYQETSGGWAFIWAWMMLARSRERLPWSIPPGNAPRLPRLHTTPGLGGSQDTAGRCLRGLEAARSTVCERRALLGSLSLP